MGYAAYREHPGTPRTGHRTVFAVLEVVVPCADAAAVRRCVSGCAGAGVLRCEPLLHETASADASGFRVRLMVRLPMASYAQVLHGLLLSAPQGVIGRLLSWREHLARCERRRG
ncbi:MAG: hypothetical protein REJ24_21810 [Rhodocyclaceae bacterium]|nr:hypothetical protein [Rhodocyclaceae bacterium]MDQ8002652.1 hypothetical protein [Pseudomonadota bacterium]